MGVRERNGKRSSCINHVFNLLLPCHESESIQLLDSDGLSTTKLSRYTCVCICEGRVCSSLLSHKMKKGHWQNQEQIPFRLPLSQVIQLYINIFCTPVLMNKALSSNIATKEKDYFPSPVTHTYTHKYTHIYGRTHSHTYIHTHKYTYTNARTHTIPHNIRYTRTVHNHPHPPPPTITASPRWRLCRTHCR